MQQITAAYRWRGGKASRVLNLIHNVMKQPSKGCWR